MESFREQRCRACLGIFHVCRRCDRGQVYCGQVCRVRGRRRVVHDAKRRYRQHELVRADERERQRERRGRVRDPGSPKVAPDASVPAAATSTPMDGGQRGGEDDDETDQGPAAAMLATGSDDRSTSSPVESSDDTHQVDSRDGPIGGMRPPGGQIPCAVCGRVTAFVRFGWLRSARRRRPRARARVRP
jgi:hypothetical protein